MPYLSEPEPVRGTTQEIQPGILRLTAGNSGPMTYHGTNTYIIDEPDGLVVIDPGPDDSGHVDAIIAATGGAVARILLTHAHLDHFGAVKALRERTGAPVASFHVSADPEHHATIELFEGSRIGSLSAVHTPGHAPDHLCFARDDGILFTGDHVMAWCSTVVGPPPRGNMMDFFSSLQRLIARRDTLYLPGHGPPLSVEPQAYVRENLDRRMSRESEIMDAVTRGMAEPADIAHRLYNKTHPVLQRAAERNVRSHLYKLVSEGRVREDGGRYVAG